MESGKKLKISDPTRVRNIIVKFSSAQMQCLVRTKDSQAVGIRASFGPRNAFDDAPLIDLLNISPIGIHRLREGMPVMIEVVGTSAQVIFTSVVRRMSANIVSIDIPALILNVERRANLRCKTTTQSLAFAQLNCWNPTPGDMASPPYIPPFNNLRSWLSIGDFSVGGVCLVTRFPSVYNFLESGMSDDRVHLWLPRSTPMVMNLQVRWKKIIREKRDFPKMDASMLNNVRTLSEFRMGMQFVNPSEEQLTVIRQFMRFLMHAQAI